MLCALNEDKEKWENKRNDVEDKVKEISPEKKSLQTSLDITLPRHEDLDKAVFDLTEETMSTSGVYFERTKEKIHFLYPNLDLIQMDFIKDVWGSELVDEDTIASRKFPTPIKDTNGQDEVMTSG